MVLICARAARASPVPPQARGHYMAGLASGLRNDINDDVLSMRQVRGAVLRVCT